MARRADPEGIRQARCNAIRDRLSSSGEDPEVAERWCDAWEAETVLRDLKRDGNYRDSGRFWVDTHSADTLPA